MRIFQQHLSKASRDCRRSGSVIRHQHRSLTPRPVIRTYYSVHHPDPQPFPSIQEAILSASLKHVPEYGFTDSALLRGTQSTGYLEASVQLFPRGPFDLINYHLVTQRLSLKDRVQFSPNSKLSLGRKIHALTWERLIANKDIIHHWQDALAQMSLLENIPSSLTELNLLADEIWFLAGDTTVDFSWYTKRASLAGVYASTEIFMTTDSSKDFEATQEFLDRRLKDVQVLGGALGGLTSYAGFWAGNSVNLMRSWGLRV